MDIKFAQEQTKYKGTKMKVAVVIMAGRHITLGLNDTARCAVGDRGEQGNVIAGRVLRNLAEANGLLEDGWEPNGAAEQLHAHCRDLLGMKPVEKD